FCAESSARFSLSKCRVGAVSLRLEMLQVARLSPKLLGDSRDLVRQFLDSQRHPSGGFSDRGGESDLYYTVFGFEGFQALREEPPISEARAYLQRFGGGERLDFVHLACLCRCWAGICRDYDGSALLERLEKFRRADGGYGSVYSAF